MEYDRGVSTAPHARPDDQGRLHHKRVRSASHVAHELRIGGLQRFSLCDYPGRIAGVVFTQGCNFCCPFCHNGQLIPRHPRGQSAARRMRPDEVLDFFHSRIGQLDAAVISGGEPTIQPGLAEFVGELRGMGFAVKLDTNGSRPEVLAKLLDRELLDYVAMDLKATPEKYAQLAGVEVSLAQVFRSAALLARSGIDHEFRTTVVDRLLSPEDLAAIEALVPRGSTYRRQRFLPELAREPSLRRPFTPSSHGRHR